jgi:predicted DNA-binding WGR domain protein
VSGVYLTRRDPTKNVARFHRLFIAPNLWGEWTLFREWRRIGSSGTVRANPYPNAGSALLAMQALVRAKLRRGYHSSGHLPEAKAN